MSGIHVLPKVKPKRGGTTPDPNSIQLGEVPKEVTIAEPESKVTDSGLLPSKENKDHYDTSSPFSTITSDSESSDEDDISTDSLTSHIPQPVTLLELKALFYQKNPWNQTTSRTLFS